MEQERFQHIGYIPKRNYQGFLVEGDGQHDIGRWSNVSANKTANFDNLTEIHGGREVEVLSECRDEQVSLTGSFREFLSPEFLSIFMGDYQAPTFESNYTLRQRKITGRLLTDTDSGLTEYALINPFGLPQSLSATMFPPPTGPAIAANGTGTIADGAKYVWIIPWYQATDPEYGVALATYTPANWATLKRCRDIALGTPSASATVTLAGGPQGVKVDWTRVALNLTDTEPIPSGYVVVIGTTDVLTAGTSMVSAIVTGWTTETATIAALGATAFGAAPAVGDMYLMQVCTGLSGGLRVWTDTVENTDWTIDKSTGIIQRVSGGLITGRAPVRLITWQRFSPTAAIDVGTGQQSNNYRHLRLENWRSKGVDPDTRAPRGVIVDCPRVNFAGLASDLLSTNPDGFHNPLPFNLKASFDATAGYTVRILSVAPENLSLFDYFSNDVLPAAA